MGNNHSLLHYPRNKKDAGDSNFQIKLHDVVEKNGTPSERIRTLKTAIDLTADGTEK